MTDTEYGRVITAMVTPFDEEGNLDLDRARELADTLVSQGNDGLLVCGTTGESPALTTEEKLQLLRAVVDEVGERAFIWAGTGCNNTTVSADLTREAERIGAHGVTLVTPYYNKPPQEALYRHFRAVADSTRLPVMLYNVPGRTSCNLEAATVARLAELDNVVAVKEASGNLDQVTKIRHLTSPDFLIYSGDDSLTLPILSVGGAGVVSVAGHLVSREIQNMISAFFAGDYQTALELHLRLYPLARALFMTTSPIPVKAALGLAGFPVGACRQPLMMELAPEQEQELAKVLARYSFEAQEQAPQKSVSVAASF